MARDVSEHRKAAIVAAAKALREDRLEGGVALLVAAGFGLMVSKANLREPDGKIEVQVMDLVGKQTEVGQGIGLHTAGALLMAIRPMLEEAGVRPPKLRGIRGGRAIDKHRDPPPYPLDEAEARFFAEERGESRLEDWTVGPQDGGAVAPPLVFDGHRGMVRPKEP